MKKWIQRIRGAIGTGLTWAAGWAPVGAITGGVAAAVLGLPLSVVIVNYAVMFGVLGFIGGTMFSTILSLADGGRSFDQLSRPRFIAWGALGGLVLGTLAVTAGLLGVGPTVGAVLAGVSTLLGAGSAAGTLAIATAAHDKVLLEEGEEVDRTALTEDSAQQRLGAARRETLASTGRRPQ